MIWMYPLPMRVALIDLDRVPIPPTYRTVRCNARTIATVESYLDDMIGAFAIGLQPLG